MQATHRPITEMYMVPNRLYLSANQTAAATTVAGGFPFTFAGSLEFLFTVESKIWRDGDIRGI